MTVHSILYSLPSNYFKDLSFEIYLVNVKTMRMISQIFVAFSEKLNFKNTPPENLSPNFVYSTKPTFFGSKPRTKDPKGTI